MVKRVVTTHVIKIPPSYLSARVCHRGMLLAIVCSMEKDRSNPVVFKGSDSAHDFIGQITKALFGLVVAVVKRGDD